MHFPVFIFRLTLQFTDSHYDPALFGLFYAFVDQDGSRVPEFTCIS